MMKKLFCLSVAICSFFCAQSQQTKLLTAEKHNEYGLVYSLPVTAFKIEVVVVKETQTAGPFYKYSKIFTKEANAVPKDKVTWSIESVNITPYGVPDEENRYLMQLKSGATTFISVAEDGMLLSINKEVDIPQPESFVVDMIVGEVVSGKEYLDFVNEDFIAAQSSYKQAQLLAEELMEIREAKLSLTRGTADTMPTDGKQLEIMLASLEKQEKALMNAFTGSIRKERIVRTFNFIPEEEGKFILCKLSPSDGLIDAKSKNGDPLYISVKVLENAQLPVDTKGEEKKVPKDAVMYCIPGSASLSLALNNTNLYSQDYPMSQFGMIFGLNPSIFTDKKEPSYAVFNPTTGALIELGTIKVQ